MRTIFSNRVWRRSFLVCLLAAIAICGQSPSPAGAAQSTAALIRRIAKTYAQNAVANGASVGIEVGVVYGNEAPQFAAAGDAISGGRRRGFTPNSIFQIGSVSKVFTTNLLGQRVAGGSLNLDAPLSSFSSEIGTLEPLTGEVTLEELGDFTGGFPSYAEICGAPRVPGCLPSARPPISDYSAQDMAAFFRTAQPMNFFTDPPELVDALPAPYNYSDFSIGLMGLLIGAAPGGALSNAALTGWFSDVQSDILQPLGMKSTFLYGATGAMVADGYVPALASVTVSGGRSAIFRLSVPGRFTPSRRESASQAAEATAREQRRRSIPPREP